MSSKPKYRRGEIYWANVPYEHVVGFEQADRRPWVIMSRYSYIGTVLAVPLSAKIKKTELPQFRSFRMVIPATEVNVPEGDEGLQGLSMAMPDQMRVLDLKRFEEGRIGVLSKRAVNSIEAGLVHILKLPGDL
jgi:mRNA-degrading endonuclease toxin of MazEF toxin-antitoxin module